MQTTQEIADEIGCTVQAVNKARRKAEQEHNLKLGTPDPRDKRVIRFAPQEKALILNFAPSKKASNSETQSDFRNVSETVSETSYYDSELDGEFLPGEFVEAPPALVVLRPRPLAKNPNLLPAKAPEIVSDTSALDRGIKAANSVSAYSANELTDYVNDFVDAKFDTMLAGLDHAIAAIGANALNKKVQKLSQPQQAETPKSRVQK